MATAEVGLRRADLQPPRQRQRRPGCWGDPPGSIAPGTEPFGAGSGGGHSGKNGATLPRQPELQPVELAGCEAPSSQERSCTPVLSPWVLAPSSPLE